MDRDALAKRLMVLFLGELEEHQHTLESDLLALEREPSEEARRELVENLFRAAHSLKGAARAVHAGAIESLCHRLEQSLSELRGSASELTPGQVHALLVQVDAVKEAAAQLRGEAAKSAPRESASAPTSASPSTVSAPLLPPANRAPPASERASEPERSTATDLTYVGSAFESAAQPRSTKATASAPELKPATRVATEKLDLLLASSGDLVVASARVQARVEQLATVRDELQALARRTPAQLLQPASEATGPATWLHRLERRFDAEHGALRRELGALTSATRRVDDEVRGLRMTPIREACEGLERSVRDLARSADKEVAFAVEGEQVELDRELVQRLRAPLLHLVRNAISHGIEPPAERLARNKSRAGRVRLRAEVRGAIVELTVEDDGAGFDLPAIRARALRLGLPAVDNDDEIATYAFAPGLSTAASVDEVAGRGVGLDAVKRAVEALHGAVTVRSRAGEGTRFTLSLPLTLSKLRCLLVRVAGKPYAIPTSHALRALRFSPDDTLHIGGNPLVRAESELVPLVRLAELLGLADAPPSERSERAQALVVTTLGRSVALVTPELVGERECVVHKLPARIAGARFVSGATLLSTGQVALVLHGGELGRAAIASLARPSAPLFRSPGLRARRVLVADDSTTTRALIKSIVESGGYHVAAARDGEEALRMLHEQPFDLLVSDVQMPHLDGFELTRTVRLTPTLARLPVILVTSLEGERDRLRGLDAGANAYLGKSAFDHQVLLDTIAGLV